MQKNTTKQLTPNMDIYKTTPSTGLPHLWLLGNWEHQESTIRGAKLCGTWTSQLTNWHHGCQKEAFSWSVLARWIPGRRTSVQRFYECCLSAWNYCKSSQVKGFVCPMDTPGQQPCMPARNHMATPTKPVKDSESCVLKISDP